jgi:2-succinyl-6-hydroxy-2,4-cyclohexadiene-1-carboxylate synthase
LAPEEKARFELGFITFSQESTMYVEYWGDSPPKRIRLHTLPSLLLLHGFMGSSADFHPMIPRLSQHFRCICVDLPGHGQTMIRDDDFASTAEQILAIAPDNCYLFGYSLGGRLALYLALHYPNRWQKVILESASFGLPDTQMRQQRQCQDSAIARKLRQPDLDFTAFIQNWYRQPVFAGINNYPNFPQLLASRVNNQPLSLARSLETMGLGQQPYLGKLLKANEIPLLLLVGEQDTKFVEINKQMASLCPQAKLNIVPNYSHNIHFQQLDLWLKAVLEFLV